MATIDVSVDTQADLITALSTASAGDTIRFTNAGTISLSSTLVIAQSVTIDGAATGGGSVTLQGNSTFTDVSVTGATVTLENLTIADGTGVGAAGAAGTSATPQGGNGGDAAGGIFNDGGVLTVNAVAFVNDTATGGAGGDGYTWTDFSGSGGGGGGAGGSAAGAIFNEAGSVQIANLSFTNVTATGGSGGAGGSGAGANYLTDSGSLAYGGYGGQGGTDGQDGVDGQSGNGPGGGFGAPGGYGGTAAVSGVVFTVGLTAAGTSGTAGSGQNALGGGGGGGGGGGTSWQDVGGVGATVACFAEGVRLLTADGYVPVESLRVGDRLMTASGVLRPAIWIGRRRIDIGAYPDPRQVLPVRIAPHSFGPNLPARPVVLSPEHAVFLEGVLVPVGALVDGERIAPLPVAQVTYWHVELETHDAVLAENLPCETYLENDNRGDFEGGVLMALRPGFAGSDAADARPFAPVRRQGAEVEALRLMVRGAAPMKQEVLF
jgi:hypothetical protein